MKVSHEEYLKNVLRSAELELENLNTNHRITIAVYEAKKETLYRQINSIENQLSDE